jgi:hypothetical protein
LADWSQQRQPEAVCTINMALPRDYMVIKVPEFFPKLLPVEVES